MNDGTKLIRILHTVVRMDRGGYETLLMNLYRQLDRSVFQFDFLCSMPGDFDEEILDLGGHIHRVPFITEVGPFKYAQQVYEVLKQNPDYQIVHSHMDKFSGIVMRTAHNANVPVRIAHSHNTQSEGGLHYKAIKAYYGMQVLPHATDFMACSKPAAEWMFGADAEKAIILYNGINLSSFTPNSAMAADMRRQLGCETGFVVGHVGRFTKQKNHAFLLKIFESLLTIRPDSHLLLVGDGPLRQEMEQIAYSRGIKEKIHFLGIREDVPQVLQAMDCFVFPSLHEGLGISVVEAQAAGLRCFVSKAVPKEAYVSDKLTSLSLSDSATVWARALASKDHPSEKFEDISRYDIKTVCKTLTDFYNEKHMNL